MDPLVGKSFGPYKVLEKIGEGGMAVVYRGFQESLNRYVAIKVLRGDLARNQEFILRFRREALAVAKLSHPNILHVYDAGVEHGVYYLVMDYARGGSLQEQLAQGPIPIERAISIVAQVADALDYAHRQGLVHRDVKPNNILISPDGRPVLTDFGIAKALYESTQLTHTGTSIGTPAYMAPEQVEGRPADSRTDIYALGIVLFETLTGQVPFRGETPMALLYKHLHATPPPMRQLKANIPVWLEAVVAKALAKQPEARYQTAGEFAQALRQHPVDEVVPVVPRTGRKTPTPIPSVPVMEPQAKPARQKGRGKLLMVLLVAIGALVVLLALGAMLLVGGKGRLGSQDTPAVVTQVIQPGVVTQVVPPGVVTVVITPGVMTVVVTPGGAGALPAAESAVASIATPEPHVMAAVPAGPLRVPLPIGGGP